MNGPVAQQGSERRPAEPEVPGSSPGGPAITISLLILLIILTIPLDVSPAQHPYFDAVVVRGDIYTDWAVAMAYGITHGSWVIHLTSDNEEEVLNLLAGFMRFRKGVSILIIGAPNAVPIEFEERLRGMGATVRRIGGATRLDTSLLLAMYYWSDCRTLVLADGLNSSYYMAALSVAVEKNAPIIYTKDGRPPEGFQEALSEHLTEVKDVVVIGNSLSPDVAEDLASSGYKVEVVGEVGSAKPVTGVWSPSLVIREIANPLPLAVGLLVGALVTYLVARWTLRREEVPNLMDFFTMDERKLIEVVMERGEVFQEELPDLTGFSKPKISRLLKDLVDRKVVERKKYGKTYLVRLTDRFKSQAS